MVGESKWCPKCGAEYKPFVTECSDCVVPLVDEPPATDDHSAAEWNLADWDDGHVRDVLSTLRTWQITHEWDASSNVLRTSRADETRVEAVVARIDAGLLVSDPQDVAADDLADPVDASETPVVAGLGRRIVGFVLDNVVLSLAGTAILNLFFRSSVLEHRRFPMTWFVVVELASFAYYFASVAIWARTLGKQVAGTRVVDSQTGEDASPKQALVRALVPALLPLLWVAAPVGGLVVYGAALVDPERRGLHDRAAGTVVVTARVRRRPRTLPSVFVDN